MILIISPAKNMADAAVLPGWQDKCPLSQPAFLQEAAFLSGELKKFAPWQLETILGVNPSLALKVPKVFCGKGQCPGTACLPGITVPAPCPRRFFRRRLEHCPGQDTGYQCAVWGASTPGCRASLSAGDALQTSL